MNHSLSLHGAVTERVRKNVSGKGREGKGREGNTRGDFSSCRHLRNARHRDGMMTLRAGDPR